MRKLILSMIGMAVYRWLTSPSNKKSGNQQYADRTRRDSDRRARG